MHSSHFSPKISRHFQKICTWLYLTDLSGTKVHTSTKVQGTSTGTAFSNVCCQHANPFSRTQLNKKMTDANKLENCWAMFAGQVHRAIVESHQEFWKFHKLSHYAIKFIHRPPKLVFQAWNSGRERAKSSAHRKYDECLKSFGVESMKVEPFEKNRSKLLKNVKIEKL